MASPDSCTIPSIFRASSPRACVSSPTSRCGEPWAGARAGWRASGSTSTTWWTATSASTTRCVSPMLGKPRRLALLAEGSFTPLDGKTAVGVLRYRPDEVAAVIDSTRAGQTAQACVGLGGSIPVVADVPGAAALGADSLLIGIAPQGGELPQAW